MRRLGVGGGGSGGDRPLRAQIVVALVVGLTLIAVPLYLVRRPSGTEHAVVDAGARLDAAAGVVSAVPGAALSPDAGKGSERVRLGAMQRIKCSASPGARGSDGNLCDALPYFEDALKKSIAENVDCAPKTGKEGSINYVLTVDFSHRRLHVFPGASGTWKGPQARRAAECVKRAMPTPSWESIQHQYRYYSIAILATFPAPGATRGPPGAPIFE